MIKNNLPLCFTVFITLLLSSFYVMGYVNLNQGNANMRYEINSRENDLIIKDSSVTDSSFLIKDHPSKSYQGKFKQGKPFEGYFKKKILEHTVVDYYENGEKIFQYSRDYFKRMMDDENSYLGEHHYLNKTATQEVLDITSAYKNGKIHTGYEYTENNESFTTKKILDGEVEAIHIEIFAINYYNGISINTDNGAIVITSSDGYASKIRVVSDSEGIKCSLLVDEEIIAYKTNQAFDIGLTPKNSVISSVNNNNEPLTIVMNREFEKEQTSLIKGIFQNLSLFPYNSLDAFYNHFDLLQNEEAHVDTESLPVAYIETNDRGAIENGIYWENQDGGQYHEFQNGNAVGIKKSTLKDFNKVINHFFEKLYSN